MVAVAETPARACLGSRTPNPQFVLEVFMNQRARTTQFDCSKIKPKPLLNPSEISEWLKVYLASHSEIRKVSWEKPEVADLVICIVDSLRPGNEILQLYEKFKKALC